VTAEQLATYRENLGTQFRSVPPGIVVDELGPGTLDLAADYRLFRGLTAHAKKFTVTSPYMLAKTIANAHYADLDGLVMAPADILHAQVAAIDAEVIQVDEANVSGHPDDGPLAAAGINRVLAGVSGDRAVHLCFGNYGGQPIQQGVYRKLVAFLNELDTDHVVLELARRPDAELNFLAELRSDLGIGVGVIDIKDNEVESADTVARRIQDAATVLGHECIRYVHPDCGFWMLPRSASDAKMRALVQGRDLFEGR
jgi:5-methyltetrahydropteroyltriglutamate--homocysteine methyltransferase